MTVFGKEISEYVAFAKIVIGLVLIVGVLRLALSLGGVPNGTTKWLSMSAVVWLGVVWAGIRVVTSGFGSYKQLLPVVFFMNLAAQVVAIVAILIAIGTAKDNIFSAPEYAFGGDGKTWAHAAAHTFVGTTVGTFVYWLMGSLVMFITKRVAGPNRSGERASA